MVSCSKGSSVFFVCDMFVSAGRLNGLKSQSDFLAASGTPRSSRVQPARSVEIKIETR